MVGAESGPQLCCSSGREQRTAAQCCAAAAAFSQYHLPCGAHQQRQDVQRAAGHARRSLRRLLWAPAVRSSVLLSVLLSPRSPLRAAGAAKCMAGWPLVLQCRRRSLCPPLPSLPLRPSLPCVRACPQAAGDGGVRQLQRRRPLLLPGHRAGAARGARRGAHRLHRGDGALRSALRRAALRRAALHRAALSACPPSWQGGAAE